MGALTVYYGDYCLVGCDAVSKFTDVSEESIPSNFRVEE
jgi:hypothetical protein